MREFRITIERPNYSYAVSVYRVDRLIHISKDANVILALIKCLPKLFEEYATDPLD